jgi:hypothetical protein
VGLRCDRCGKTLEYRERIVVLDRGTASYITEGVDTIGSEPEAKFHEDCYRQLRAEAPRSHPEPR